MKYWPIVLLSLAFLLPLTAAAQDPPRSYWVVIGAFRQEANADRLVKAASKQGLSAQKAINPAKDLFYVYIFQSNTSKPAFAQVIKIKAETNYKDAWVFRGTLDVPGAITEQPTVPPVVEPEPTPAQPEVQPEPEPEQQPVEPTPTVEEQQPAIVPAVVEEKPKPAGKPFLFRMVSEASGNPVVGEVHVFESAKASQYQIFKANELVYLPPPQNRNATYVIASLAAGYKEMRRTISYADPAASATETGPDQEFVISLPLVRVKTGDYIEFSNVRFFQNTAILQPESQNELDGLAQLMKENTKYKIRIHGHCNGEGNRDIVSKGSSPEFFATHKDNLRENASAKRLTQLRADIVKEYLVSQGIEEGRIQTKAEGGKYIIFPRNSTLASRNDRVEVEVKKGK
jgi:outer membrane protein OmpA-like peptidoglycan-associated protein